jgi:hypothetical protein
MIRPLRRRHRVMIAGVALVVLPLFVAALASRNLPGPMDRVPEVLLRQPGLGAVVAETEDLWAGLGVAARVGGDVLELRTGAELPRPDVLLYWSPEAVEVGAALPDRARLVGSLAGNGPERFILPAEASGGTGFLVLYSLAHQELFAAAPVPGGGG